MADSLKPKCTPLKREYDACFNSWFEGYLEPTVSPDQRTAFSKKKAEEFQEKCGKVWEQYRQCVQVCVLFLSTTCSLKLAIGRS
jgi:TRIAP1/MDM35 family protein